MFSVCSVLGPGVSSSGQFGWEEGKASAAAAAAAAAAATSTSSTSTSSWVPQFQHTNMCLSTKHVATASPLGRWGVDRAMGDQTALRLVGGPSAKIAIIEPVDRETVEGRRGVAWQRTMPPSGRAGRRTGWPTVHLTATEGSRVSLVCSCWRQSVAGDAAGTAWQWWQPLEQLLWLRCAGPPAAEEREWCLLCTSAALETVRARVR